MKLKEIASLTKSVIDHGDGNLEITGATGLELAVEGDVTFLANARFKPLIKKTLASAIFLNETEQIDRTDIAILRAKDPSLAYTRVVRAFQPDLPVQAGIHHSAVIHESARVSATAEIMANSVIGDNCEIGDGVKIFPNVTVYDGAKVGAGSVLHSGVSVREDCEIGARCVVHNNSTIGSDGFGYARDEDRRWLKIPQVGRVVLEDDVEIGANSAIDRASVGETRIKNGAKIDNLVQIGHSCIVGEDALICSQTGLAGSSVIGKRVILAGQVGIAGHLTVGDDAVLTAKSATSHDIEPGKIISGVPGFDNRDWLRSTAAFRRLGEIARTVRDLERKVSKLLGE